MKRCNLVELHDLPGCPDVVRNLVTDYLQSIMCIFSPFTNEPTLEILAGLMESSGEDNFFDLCSGGGGSWFSLLNRLRERTGRPASVVFSDKYPNADAARRASVINGMVYLDESIDARRPPANLKGILTLFNCLHHFEPDEARLILAAAIKRGQPVVVLETLQRSGLNLLRALILAVSVPFMTLMVKPFKLSRLLMTYVVPIAPALMLWDGCVSVLRSYKPDELLRIVKEIDDSRYVWKAGTCGHPLTAVTYLVGRPAPSNIRPI